MLAVAARECPDEGAAVDPVGIEERLDERLPHSGRTVEAEVEAPLREPAEEPEERAGVVAAGGRSLSVPPSRRMTSTNRFSPIWGCPGRAVSEVWSGNDFILRDHALPASQYAEGPRRRALWSRCAKRFN